MKCNIRENHNKFQRGISMLAGMMTDCSFTAAADSSKRKDKKMKTLFEVLVCSA
jgi:hypothetical protein